MPAMLDKTMRALAVVDPRWSVERILATATTATEADLEPGDVLDDGGALAPRLLGAQSRDLEVVVVDAGLPGAVGYRLAGEDDASIRGRESLWAITGAAPCDLTVACDQLAAAVEPTSQRLAVVWSSGGGVGTLGIAVFTPVTGAWTQIAPPTMSNATWGNMAPTVVVWRGGDLVVVGATSAIRTSDLGATWRAHARYPSLGMASTSRPWLVVDGDGRWLLGQDSSGDLILSSSTDYGATWADQGTIADAGISGATTTPDGRIVIAYLDAADSYRPKVVVLGSAVDRVSQLEAIEVATTTSTSAARVGVIAPPEGGLYVYRSTTTSIIGWQGTDAAAGWSASALTVYGSAASDVLDPVFVSVAGRGAIVHRPSTSGVAMILLGGWSARHVRPFLFTGSVLDKLTWLATAAPSSGLATFGTSSRGLAVQGFSIATTATAGGYTYTPGVLTWQAIEAETVLVIASGAQTCGIRSRTNNGTFESSVTLYLQDDGFRLRDELAGAWLDPKVLVDLSTPMAWRIEHGGAAVRVSYRRPHDAAWIIAASTPTGFYTLSFVAAAATQVIRLGSVASGTNQLQVRYFNVVGNTVGLLPVYLTGLRPFGATSQEGVNGCVLPPTGGVPVVEASEVGAAARLVARGGVGLEGEVYELQARGRRPLDALFAGSPSPAEVYRSTAYSAFGAAWRVVLDLSADTLIGASPSVALVVRGCTTRRVRLLASTAAAPAPATVGTLDLAEGFVDLDYELNGDILSPPVLYTGTAGGRYLGAGELVGGYAVLDRNGTPKVRRIVEQSAGWWGATDGPRPSIRLEGLDGTEAAAAEVDLIAVEGVLVVDFPAGELYRYWGLEVPLGAACFGDVVEIGRAWLCGLRALGKQYDRGWVWRVEPRVAVVEDEAGSQRRASLGPLRRTATIDWAHGAHRRAVRQSAPAEVDYFANEEGAPLVARDAVFDTLEGVVKASDDGAAPVVLLATPPASGDTLTDPTRFLVGFIDGPIGARNVAGDEGVDEYERVDALTIVEAV